jgi:hypothetical protein
MATEADLVPAVLYVLFTEAPVPESESVPLQLYVYEPLPPVTLLVLQVEDCPVWMLFGEAVHWPVGGPWTVTSTESVTPLQVRAYVYEPGVFSVIESPVLLLRAAAAILPQLVPFLVQLLVFVVLQVSEKAVPVLTVIGPLPPLTLRSTVGAGTGLMVIVWYVHPELTPGTS